MRVYNERINLKCVNIPENFFFSHKYRSTRQINLNQPKTFSVTLCLLSTVLVRKKCASFFLCIALTIKDKRTNIPSQKYNKSVKKDKKKYTLYVQIKEETFK